MPTQPLDSTLPRLISLKRLVDGVRGTKTDLLYFEIKRMAVLKDTDWEPVISRMSEPAVLARIQWCEAFLKDLVLIEARSGEFERRMARKGADMTNALGSRQHEEQKLRLLLSQGEAAAAAQDACEDVLLRGVCRLMTLVTWACEVYDRCRSAPRLCHSAPDPRRSALC